LSNGAGYITTSFTNTNQLTNGAGFVTFTNNNQLTNGAGYITTSFTNTNQLVNGAGFVTFTNNNQLTNGAGYITGISGIDTTGTSFFNQLNVSGVSTFNSQIHLPDNTKIMLGADNDLQIVHVPNFNSIQGDQPLYLQSPSQIILKQYNGSEVYAKFTKNSSVELYYDNSKKFETTGAGATVTGTLFSNQLNVSGVATFSSNVTIGGTLTYEDVTNIDSVGLITARNGINVSSGGVNVTGIVTATSYDGPGSNLTGIVTGIIAGDNINVSGSTGQVTITGLANTANVVADSLQVTGITTLGVVTSVTSIQATTYYGDGSKLTGISAGAGGTENVSSNTTISGIITASEQFYPPTLTTSERDALTVTQGALIFNTTENKVQMYLGSEWKSLAFELDTYTSIGI
jgi:hypothetical protein